jgi:phospholipid/cholesterol/gamma-HCH transport system substrate-binding protein
MESHAKYTLVGTVVLVLLGLTLFGGLWLSRAGESRDYALYAVYFRHHSLAGLQEDSAVTMRGIKVGTVKSLAIASPDIERVKVILKIDAGTPVKIDTEAVVQRNLLTGLAYIDLVRTTSDAPFLVKRETEEYPRIPEGRSQFDAITSDIPKMVEEFNELVARARGFLTPENQQAAAEILDNVRTVSAKLARSDNDFTVISRNLAKLSLDLDILARNIDTRTEELSSSLTRTSSTFALEAENAGRDLGRAAQGLAATLEKYQDPASLLAGPAPAALGPGE